MTTLTIFSDIVRFDQDLTLAINSLHSPLTDGIWKIFSNIQIWFPMYAIVVGFLFWRLGWKRALVIVLALALTILCCDQTANLFKDGVQRLRPCNDPYMVSNGLHMIFSGGTYGFFSGHAANSFGFAFCSLLAFRLDKRLKYRGYAAWIFIWAILVSLSRVFVSMHYFGDILAGALAGSLIGTLLFLAASAIIRRWIPSPSGNAVR